MIRDFVDYGIEDGWGDIENTDLRPSRPLAWLPSRPSLGFSDRDIPNLSVANAYS